ncbi:MAG: hypothetical protein JWL64_439 [Frankiales bacterium]|nr:hypothetical protein [Frankiales bacterium]
MTRRSSLPGAAELFRSTGEPVPVEQPGGTPARVPVATGRPVAADPAPAVAAVPSMGPAGDPTPRTARRRPRVVEDRRPTGRERHDEKITVYVSADELLDLEHARLTLRGEHGLAVDRGRIVREALAVVIADLDAKGEASILVRRLLGR